MEWLKKPMKHIFTRSRNHISEWKEEVAQDNLMTLRTATIGFELFLACYGIWSFFTFKNEALTGFYAFYLLPNTILTILAVYGRRKLQLTFSRIQLLCALYIFEVMSFIIGISVFPFPDRPAIFYSLAYTMIILIFQFTFLQMASMLTVITGVFIALVVMFKTPTTISYDLVSAITTWLLNVFILYAVNNLRIRNGEIKQELKRQSHTDFLTGLLNRREMDNLFSLLYRRCTALKKNVTVVMLDLDNFKQYNDRFGHSAGDECIKYVGTKLKAFTEDTGFFAARYGGEEFALFFPECTAEEARVHAEHLHSELRFHAPDGETVTVSIGVACEMPKSGSSVYVLLERADKALYRAKSEGRDRVIFAE